MIQSTLEVSEKIWLLENAGCVLREFSAIVVCPFQMLVHSSVWSEPEFPGARAISTFWSFTSLIAEVFIIGMERFSYLVQAAN